MKNFLTILSSVLFIGTICGCDTDEGFDGPDMGWSTGKELIMDPGVGFSDAFVQINPDNPDYFRLSNGDPYIPIGCNIAYASGFDALKSYLKKLADNGGNYARVWMSREYLDHETTYGEVNQSSVDNMKELIRYAGELKIKIKFCLEEFRYIAPTTASGPTKTAYHTINGGPFTSMGDFMGQHLDLGKEVYMNKINFIKENYGDNPNVFAWELWNEMNAISEGSDQVNLWTADILLRLTKIFTRNMTTQSLGSYDSDWSTSFYTAVAAMKGNDVIQIHRYLDEGADYEICHAPVDELAADAVQTMKKLGYGRPVLLAESGAVAPKHSGEHAAYAKDLDGSILHDVLFAPFFAGAAGSGHCWHWDNYIDKNGLWHHFRKFADVVQELDPGKEAFVPARADVDGLKVYVLKGKHTLLVWCRDENNSWQKEFNENIPPQTLSGKKLNLADLLPGLTPQKVQYYDPWTADSAWTDMAVSNAPELPDFKRSLVVKITY